jgi:glycosyltransferase involved in cell wall biosynthesis/predicted SAM-dependent methyltransferase
MSRVEYLRHKIIEKLTAPLPGGLRDAVRTLFMEISFARMHRRGVRQARAYRTARHLQIHLGCGDNYKPGWVNIDLGKKADVTLDLRRALPFPAEAAAYIYGEHFFEHIDYPQPATLLLHEYYRLLEPGGALSLVVPDMELVLNAYVNGGTEEYYAAQQRWHPAWCETHMDHINYNFRQDGEHRYAYDFETLSKLLEHAGFVDVRRRAFDPALDRPERRVGSLYVSCKKPGFGTEPRRPRVTVGLPVYNGEAYLAEAIESVLGQTFTDFELIISDNGSTDGTAAIGRAYAARDPRVRYVRSPRNRGAAWNYNRLVELAQGDYFRWLAADDALAPTLLEKSVFVLDSYPRVVLAFTWTQDIDAAGRPLQVKRSTVGADAARPRARFRGLANVVPWHNCEEVFGLLRTAILRRTAMIAPYTDSDRTLLAELGLHGPFYEIPEPLFLHRVHSASSVVVNPDGHARAAWFDPKLQNKLVLPNWRQLYELGRVIRRSPVSGLERFSCYLELGRWTKRRRRYLLEDLGRTLSQLAARARHSVSAPVGSD